MEKLVRNRFFRYIGVYLLICFVSTFVASDILLAQSSKTESRRSGFTKNSVHIGKYKISANEAGAALNIIGGVLGTAALLTGLPTLPFLALASLFSLSGIYMWQWGFTRPGKVIKDTKADLKKIAKNKKAAQNIGAGIALSGAGLLALSTLGVVTGAPVVLFGTGLALSGTYLWGWGFGPPGLVKALKEKRLVPENITDLGILFSIAGIGVMTAGAFGLIGIAPALILGTVFGALGTHLWMWETKPTAFMNEFLKDTTEFLKKTTSKIKNGISNFFKRKKLNSSSTKRTLNTKFDDSLKKYEKRSFSPLIVKRNYEAAYKRYIYLLQQGKSPASPCVKKAYFEYQKWQKEYNKLKKHY